MDCKIWDFQYGFRVDIEDNVRIVINARDDGGGWIEIRTTINHAKELSDSILKILADREMMKRRDSEWSKKVKEVSPWSQIDDDYF